MTLLRNAAIGLSMTLQSLICLAQSTELNTNTTFHESTNDSTCVLKDQKTNNGRLDDSTFEFKKKPFLI